MRPRFRIRTLMFVVVGVALICALFVELPNLVIGLSLLSLLSLGPLIGVTWTGWRYQPGRLDPISGGMLGGLVQSGLLMGLVVAYGFRDAGWSGLLSRTVWGICLALLLFEIIVGVYTGVLVASFLLARPSSSPPAESVDPVHVPSEEEPAEFSEDEIVTFFQTWSIDRAEASVSAPPLPAGVDMSRSRIEEFLEGGSAQRIPPESASAGGLRSADPPLPYSGDR